MQESHDRYIVYVLVQDDPILKWQTITVTPIYT